MSKLVFKKSKSKETGLVGKMKEMYYGLICIIGDGNPVTLVSVKARQEVTAPIRRVKCAIQISSLR